MGEPGMKILVTGAKGFIGKNLVWNLRNIQQGKDQTRAIPVEEIWEYGTDTPPELLDAYCDGADFVFHLAGVNRPKEEGELRTGNVCLTEKLLDTLNKQGNSCPVMLASSIQATLTGRFSGSVYGQSKLAAEELVFDHGARTGAKVLVYRFANVFGKWCRPNYNSVVATFCHNIANGLPIRIDDPDMEMELVYIDDLVNEMLDALQGREHRLDARFCCVPVSYRVRLGQIVDWLQMFQNQPKSLVMPEIPEGSFQKKLYSAYLSYLPWEAVRFPLRMNGDERGSFTELLKTESCGQFSVNISKPGVTKGQHWHNSKWEFFIVVAGHGLIRERKIGTDERMEFEVSGERIEAVHMLPGYTHEIINLSRTENLVTLMWANEPFDPNRPDTYIERVN